MQVQTNNLATKIFGPALARLRSDAHAKAKAAVAEERRRLKKAAEAVEAARDALGSIWAALPGSLRASMKQPHDKFIANAIALKRLLATPDGRSVKQPDDKR